MPSLFHTDSALPADPDAPLSGAVSGPPAVLPVATLNRLVRETLERSFPLLWVGGEISNLTRAPSGHLYFTLKDEQAQVRCTMWRNRAQTLPFRPENGMRVEARALVTLYELRGDYQLSIEGLRRAGVGNLFEAFTRLKDKLAAEGLFDPARRRPLPRLPRALGVITSPAAAALRDVLATLARRAPHLPVILYPAPVQGVDAGPALARALAQASQRAATDGVDVFLLVRGGGSMEDLWAFNDEALAREIRRAPVPVVSGVGHETDFTIADFAADLRAATPTMAAELASAGHHAAAGELHALSQQLRQALQRRLDNATQRLDRAALRLTHPRERLRLAARDLAQLAGRLQGSMQTLLRARRTSLAPLALRLDSRRPDLQTRHDRLERLQTSLAQAMNRHLDRQRAHLSALDAHLQHLDPRAVLSRGYAIVRDSEGRILRHAAGQAPGGRLDIELADGHLQAEVRPPSS